MESQSDCMYKMAKTILKNEEDVADAMAETVLVCWEKLSTLKENRYVKTWMIRILMNKCYDLLRKKELLLTEDTVSEADAREDGYGMAEWEQVLQCLDKKYRLVMLLYYVAGFKIREVSEILDIPAATVKTRLVRGRKQLADEMKMERGRTL
ncbi:RNA polymerase subunit sigma-70 [Blautia sp. AF19-34]|nr:RNA polymerase subunit sigma-70 [Blautia sp. AF19-34]